MGNHLPLWLDITLFCFFGLALASLVGTAYYLLGRSKLPKKEALYRGATLLVIGLMSGFVGFVLYMVNGIQYLSV